MAHGAAVRDPNKERRWRKIVRRWGEGESVRTHCRKHGVNEASFYWWRRELARRDAATTTAFVPVMIEQPVAVQRVNGLVIELCGGRVLRLPPMAVSQVVELVRAIEAVS